MTTKDTAIDEAVNFSRRDSSLDDTEANHHIGILIDKINNLYNDYNRKCAMYVEQRDRADKLTAELHEAKSLMREMAAELDIAESAQVLAKYNASRFCDKD